MLHPVSLSGRVAVGFWWFAVLIIGEIILLKGEGGRSMDGNTSFSFFVFPWFFCASKLINV